MKMMTVYGEEEVHYEGKVCIDCNEYKPLSMFGARARNKFGDYVDLRNDCKQCQGNKGKLVRSLKKTNKIPEDHKCEICNRSKDDFDHRYKKNPFCLDHDHATNEFRGFICMDCNTGLARFNENPETMLRAIKYLNNKRCAGGKWENDCDDWECVGGCKYEKST